MDLFVKDYIAHAQAYTQDYSTKLITKLDLEPEIALILLI
jgi:hypothetical protein